MRNEVLKKIIIFVTVFMLVFSNCGYTLQALAATDGITLFGLNLFGSGNIDFDVYFLDENGKKQTESVSDVNSQMTMVIEVNPKSEGYLKSGTVKAVGKEEGEANFKIDAVFLESELKSESLTITTPVDETLLQSELVVESEENAILEDDNTVATENVVSEDNNTESENVETTIINEENTVEDELVDEEAALNEESEFSGILSSAVSKAEVIADNEIKLENIIENTKVYVNISFKSEDNLNPEDLYKEIKLEFEGNYINNKLEEIPVSVTENIAVGWEYTKEIEVSSYYTKVSPFKIGEKEGTIVEDTITIKRDVTEENYLPLKETKIVLNVASLSGNNPTNLDVSALKLKATKGEDVNEVTFSNDNWEYDSNNNTLTITVQNSDCKFTYGEDVFVVTLRYDYYVEDEEISLDTNGTVYVTEFSGKDNHEIEKSLDKSESIIVNLGELITYSIGTTEEKINKGKINANYNSEEEKYQSEFDTTVNVNILTKDVLNEFVLKDSKEFYIDKEGLEFETNDVKYKKVKFKYNEIQSLLEQGGSIEIKNNNGELIYILNNELVKSKEDAEISIQGDVRGIEVTFKNISVNGNISIEFIKAIGKSSYDKSAMASFNKLESRISGAVKYSEESTGTDLSEIKTEKEFSESKTEAEITMNKVSLSTTELNKNVEFKIELNNDEENSDLYVNPVFEISLPKYVANIDLKAVNMLYESGLSIGNSTIYRAEDGTLRMRIEVNGIQTEFSEGTIANGTNIIVNADIELDKFTPRKDEQVKLYYFNEGVTNYASQTKWTIDKNIPTGILKTTNGFDSYVFKLNAPSGFVTVNEIQNYDGENSIVSSFKQGTEVKEIAMEKGAQVARMNLIAINNTENQCTDVAFLGRVPVKGVTDVKTGEVLETNIYTSMLSKITENEENPLSAKVYYSVNPNADKNLNDSSNGWTEEVESASSVKSFLIVPDSTVEPGYIFRYTYEFLIPENLPFESKIYGAFGAFYNNHSDVAITYETTSADLVGVVTKPGPKVEATLSVNVGDGAQVPEASFLDYTLTVVNSGSTTAEGITVTNPIPEGTTLYEERLVDGDLFYGWFSVNKTELSFEIDKLEPGDVKEFKYSVKIQSDTNINEIRNKANINVNNLALNIESNEIINTIRKSDFDINTYSGVPNNLVTGKNFIFTSTVKNISGKNLNNVKIEYKIPEELKYKSYNASLMDKNLENGSFDLETNVFTVEVKEWKTNETLDIDIYSEVISGNSKVPNIITVTTENGTIYTSKSLDMTFFGPKLEVSQVCSVSGNTVTEGDNIEFIFSIQNIGDETAKSTSLYSEISNNLENVKVSVSGSNTDSLLLSDDNILDTNIYSIASDECINIHILGTVKDVDDDNETIISKMIISNQFISNLTTNEIILQILNDPNRKPEEINEEPKEDDNLLIDFEAVPKEELPTDEDDKQDEENNGKESNSDAENSKQEDESRSTTEEVKTQNEGSQNSEETKVDNNNQSSTEKTNNQNQSTEDTNKTVENNATKTTNKNTEESSTKKDEQQFTPKYSISGKIWIDQNKNGSIDENESGVSGVQIQLQKNNMSIKATVSTKDGSYVFRDVESGRYTVVYSYDNNLYNATVYKNVENGIEKASYARDLNDGKAVTDIIEVGNSDVQNINFGLKDKDNFDLTISKNIILAKVITNGKTVEHKYNNLDLAKLEISAKDLDKTTVELHYQIIVKNEGNISGKAMQIVDYLPKDTTLNIEQSKNWYLGNDGNVYNDSLSELSIAPGETRQLNLVLTRTMTSENTGIVANKVAITKTEGYTDSIIEKNNNNDATQELLVSVRTGYTVPLILNVIIIACCVVIVYLERSQKIKIDFKQFKIKRIYK